MRFTYQPRKPVPKTPPRPCVNGGLLSPPLCPPAPMKIPRHCHPTHPGSKLALAKAYAEYHRTTLDFLYQCYEAKFPGQLIDLRKLQTETKVTVATAAQAVDLLCPDTMVPTGDELEPGEITDDPAMQAYVSELLGE